jgi:hypothetical protein
MTLPKYQDCKYSLFISYAHRDDAAENNWISKLKEAIWLRLHDIQDKDIPLQTIHLSGENGPVHGTLSQQLDDRVKSSFSMLLVVGKHYAESGWCDKELQMFKEHFGTTGFTSRLFIIAMTKPAIEKVKASASAVWPELAASHQVWLPMYKEQNPNEPLPTGANPERTDFSDDFFSSVRKLTTPLIEAIEADWQASIPEEEQPSVSANPGYAVIDTSSLTTRIIAIAPVTTTELQAKAVEMEHMLKMAGADCFNIDQKLLTAYDPEDESSLSA